MATYKYFVSYSWVEGFGMTDVITNKKIESIEQILEISNLISKEVKSEVIVLNYKLLSIN